jgi:hypothetical protein
VPLIGWQWGVIEGRWGLAGWWLLAIVLTGLLWLGAFLAQGKTLRWRASARSEGGIASLNVSRPRESCVVGA